MYVVPAAWKAAYSVRADHNSSEVNAFAVSMDNKRATTNEIDIEIIDSGFNEDSLLPEDPR